VTRFLSQEFVQGEEAVITFEGAREFLLRHRENYDRAYADFQCFHKSLRTGQRTDREGASMYKVSLQTSYFPAQADTPFRALTIADLLREQAVQAGSRTALREILDDGSISREWSYARLLEDSERLGRALAYRHPRGARIAVFATNSPEWVLLELASALAGLTLVTVNPSFKARELKYVLEQSRSEAVYFGKAARGTPLEPIVEEACASLTAVEWSILLTDHDALFEGEDRGRLRETIPEDIVQIQYTSGTTGFPKGALLHQKGIIQSGFDLIWRLSARPGDQVLNIMPLFHTAGCVLGVLGCFANGATFLLAPGYDADMLTRVLERERPDFFLGVPTMIVGLMEAAQKSRRDVTSVRSVMSGGSMVAPDLVRKARQMFQAPVQIIYGQTEASPGITLAWADDDDADLTETIGQPLPHMEVSIRSTRDNSVCAIGEQGEICCRGYNVMAGYNDNPKATAETIDAEGWLHTGDLGRMDSRGYLRITGRVKEMIIRGGENLFPVEIENAMLEHEHIVECAVVGIPDEKWGEQVACFMRAKHGHRLQPVALKAFIRERLSPQKTPAFWVWVENWPLTGSGKIKKFALREAFQNGEYEVLTA
jgi:fatty-acyl-CoA synthase